MPGPAVLRPLLSVHGRLRLQAAIFVIALFASSPGMTSPDVPNLRAPTSQTSHWIAAQSNLAPVSSLKHATKLIGQASRDAIKQANPSLSKASLFVSQLTQVGEPTVRISVGKRLTRQLQETFDQHPRFTLIRSAKNLPKSGLAFTLEGEVISKSDKSFQIEIRILKHPSGTSLIAMSQSLDLTEDPIAKAQEKKKLAPAVSTRTAVNQFTKDLKEYFTKKEPKSLFHRIAIPAFVQSGAQAQEHHTGQILAKVFREKITGSAPFVVLQEDSETDRLLERHHLGNVGTVAPIHFAKLGKILGADSILSGSIVENGSVFELKLQLIHVPRAKVILKKSYRLKGNALIQLSTDAVVAKSAAGATLRSALFPGWGQFYNEETAKGTAFMTAGLGSLAASVGYWMLSEQSYAEYQENTAATASLRQTANERLAIANTMLQVYAFVWFVNVVDAYVDGKESISFDLSRSRALGFSF